MTRVDVPAVAAAMIGAARAEVAERWPQIEPLAECELRRLAQALADAASLVDAGSVDASGARKLAHLYQLGVRSALTTVEGLGLLTAEQAVHAGIRAVAPAVNEAARFPLL